MGAQRKSIQIEPVESTTHSTLPDYTEGFEVRLSSGVTHRVKLRRRLHHGAPIGITIVSRTTEQRSIIEQFDISPKLDTLSRSTVQEVLMRSYLQLQSDKDFALGKSKLEELANEGFCVGCRFSTIG